MQKLLEETKREYLSQVVDYAMKEDELTSMVTLMISKQDEHGYKIHMTATNKFEVQTVLEMVLNDIEYFVEGYDSYKDDDDDLD